MGLSDNPAGWAAVQAAIAFTVIGNVVVFFRLYIRLVMIKSPGAEDLCIAIAMLFSTAFTILIKVQADAGLGMHVWDLTDEQLLRPLKALYASIICYYFALAFIKASILLQYYRLFSHARVRTAIYILGAFVFLFSIETILATIFLCIPVQKFWEPSIPGHCANTRILWFTNSSLHIATDFAIIILPMPVLKQLSLPTRQKRALMIVFAIGGFACAVSILRLHSLVKITASRDLTYDNANTATWSTAEINISLICACLPALRPIVQKVLPGMFSSYNLSHSAGDINVTASRKQVTSRGTRHWNSTTNPFDGGEAGRRGKLESDDELPLQTKCWGQAGSSTDNHELTDYGSDAKNAQIVVVTDIKHQVRSEPAKN